MISIVIPTFNEASRIGSLVRYLQQAEQSHLLREIIVSDGGSRDKTVEIARALGCTVVVSSQKGRAAQLNYGARQATGEILYFLHADSYPPSAFITHIGDFYRLNYKSGCHRLAFDHRHWFLDLNCWFTRFNVNAFRFGDQGLFVNRECFEKAGGYKESLLFMEDQEIIARIRKHARFAVMPYAVTTSARKYRDNGIFRMQGIFFAVYMLYYLGFSQPYLLKVFKQLVKQDKM